MTQRLSVHFEKKEPFLEKYLQSWRHRKIVSLVPANAKLLDLGCGYRGKFLEKIKDNISSGVGIDIAVDSRLSNGKIRLMAHDLNESLPFPDNEFDAVASLANLEHLAEPGRALKEIFRVLKPNGILLLTAPSVFAKPVLELLAFVGLVSRQEIRDHKNYFDKKILTSLCQKAGFSSVSHKYFQLGMNNFLIATK